MFRPDSARPLWGGESVSTACACFEVELFHHDSRYFSTCLLVHEEGKPGDEDAKQYTSRCAIRGFVITDLDIQVLWDASLGQTGASGVLVDYRGGSFGAAYAPPTPCLEERSSR